jgi:AraC-like DNA-binding protein
MTPPGKAAPAVTEIWEIARAGDLRGGAEAARALLERASGRAPGRAAELHLVRAFCAMRQGGYAEAHRELDAARDESSRECDEGSALRVRTWRAELAYFQGRYADSSEIIDEVLPELERRGDLAYVAFALRVRIATLLARTDYEGIAALADRAVRAAEASEDDYVIVQVLNILGAVNFDRATSKLGGPHARAHLTALDPADAAPMEAEARTALAYFERARGVAERARYDFAAWYVAGNIERVQILLGNAARVVPAMRKRLRILQARGARYDEIVTRSNLAWALRTLGRHRDALHELDVARQLVRVTGTFNVLLEFLEYDRSIVLDALGDAAAARASYRRYLQLVSPGGRKPDGASAGPGSAAARRPLEPFLLKRADRFILEHLDEPFSVAELAEHCGVSWRTLEKTFADFRGLTPVAHVRNLRLERARCALEEGGATVTAVAARFGFRSPTTFTLEYRKRFGIPPSRSKRASRD